MTEERPANVVHEDAVPATDELSGSFSHRRQRLSAAAGGRRLGCSRYELPPHGRSFPFHYHLANEEAVYVLSGEGTLRLGERTVAIGPGDYVALRAEAGHAHQLVAGADAPLVYLCVSRMREPDVCIYPDSDKLGVFAGTAPGGDTAARTLCEFVGRSPRLPYLHGEE